MTDAVRRFDAILDRQLWLGGEGFSLADICVFATFYGLSQSRSDHVNDSETPGLMRWLRRCHERPGLQAAFRMGRGFFSQRAAEIRRQLGVSEAGVR